ncbi:MAG: FKBP-type peptidyl-prolyl cis-trans isomerase [Myxococcales bacterium]|nr:FKBP-type peptidyl-prolyl cis-trans isomerase [Myxococcales bacterium]
MRSSVLAVLSGAALLLASTCVGCSKDTASSGTASAAAAEAAASPATASASAAAMASASAPPSIPAPPDVAAPPPDAVKTASGLASKVLTPGTGKEHPGPADKVKVHYTGWTKSGQMFDSSVTRGEPITFPLNGVIPGWTEGLQLMVAGEKRRLWIPAALAYGDRPRAGAPAGDLVFDVELLDVTAAPKPPPVPEDAKVPPASAKKTGSGLAYRVLTPGSGTTHPTGTSNVTVHYSGWTTDGKMFDSSVVRGQPARFGLSNVIKGWTEGVQLMTKGEKARFWIPGALAYGDKPSRPGAPAGMLVFDIELIDFQ